MGDFFIPPLCVICDSPLSSDSWFCTECLLKLRNNCLSRKACPRCSQNLEHRSCTCDIVWDFPFQKVFSLYDFDDLIRAIAHNIKYKGRRRFAFHVGYVSASLIPSDFLEGLDLVIPVPLHKSRLRQRGYNQAEWFARGVLKGIGKLELRTDLLLRVRKTGTQTKLDKEMRRKNLASAFKVGDLNSFELRGKSILLVDDILTTGATVEACTNELLRNGCRSVRVLSLGRD